MPPPEHAHPGGVPRPPSPCNSGSRWDRAYPTVRAHDKATLVWPRTSGSEAIGFMSAIGIGPVPTRLFFLARRYLFGDTMAPPTVGSLRAHRALETPTWEHGACPATGWRRLSRCGQGLGRYPYRTPTGGDQQRFPFVACSRQIHSMGRPLLEHCGMERTSLMTEPPTIDAISVNQLHAQLTDLQERLIRRYPAVPSDMVRRLSRDESDRFAGAKVHVFVPILVERAVRDQLDHRVTTR